MGANKGSEFERYICKQLTIWLTGNKKPYAFWRMPASGALATIDSLNNDLSGDVVGITPEAQRITSGFSIEIKTGYPRTNFWQLFKNNKNYDLRDFWQQCVGDAEKAGKKPMLIYRKKGQAVIVGITVTDMTDFGIFSIVPELLNTVPYLSVNFGKLPLPMVCFYDMTTFFKLVTPNKMKEFLEIDI
jgi:hypothetical protein